MGNIADDFALIAKNLKRLQNPQEEEPLEDYCSRCENSGWVQVWSPFPPAFGTCPDCCNPKDYPSP